ncbi:MAG: glutamine--tRNA ligase/YqeY domain fusion protein [Christensenellales bacterium]|jgi:glutaminyl-tRNA synthetase
MDNPTNFIEEIITKELSEGKNGGRVYTRFPPEPNGYLHIGHAKAIYINFTIKQKYNGKCNLRFDDTNPTKEEVEYVEAIQEDIKWLGFEWDEMFYASEYFEALYQYAEQLILKGKAYVCDLSAEQMREYRGTLTEPGRESPWRERGVEENLKLFRAMRAGEFPDGSRVLRAKIDMASPNLNMRDPVMYRIMRATHHNTGDEWLIYPMYDYAHPISDAIEKITHSICTLEFEDHRPLYDWFVREIGFEEPPRQIEFARLNLTRTIMSKRYLKRLVDEGLVDGWDDPRMPTICGLRRRGYPPRALLSFCEKIGVAKSNSVVDLALLEHCAREELSATAKRVMAVLNPLKVTITNYPDQIEWLVAENNPEDESAGVRKMPFGREIYIERDDFMEDPPKKFFRLAPGREVRLKNAYIIKCEKVLYDEDGNVSGLECSYDPDTKSGMPGANRKVKGTLHWVEATNAADIKAMLYDPLLTDDADGDFIERMNPDSLIALEGCKAEPCLLEAKKGDQFQFMRQGYFCRDTKSEGFEFNRVVSLKDTWAKIAASKS